MFHIAINVLGICLAYAWDWFCGDAEIRHPS
jgi:hypothetical protein